VKRLLLHARSYERISEQLAGLSDQLSVATMADDGVLRLDGREVSPEEAAVDAAWTNADAFFSPAVRAFMAAVLKSPEAGVGADGSAGVEAPVFSAIVNKGAVLTTTHVQAVGIADYVLWGVLDHWHRGPERRAAQAEARWEKLSFREDQGLALADRRLRRDRAGTAARARAFGGRVTGVRRSAGATRWRTQ
jgi:phosphoglycerate dehydrogenase-like enzyme